MGLRWTKDAEDAFVAALERFHESRRSLFTTELLYSLSSFVPSALDPVLKKDLFPALTVLRGFVEARPISHSTTDCFVKSLVRGLVEVGRVDITSSFVTTPMSLRDISTVSNRVCKKDLWPSTVSSTLLI